MSRFVSSAVVLAVAAAAGQANAEAGFYFNDGRDVNCTGLADSTNAVQYAIMGTNIHTPLQGIGTVQVPNPAFFGITPTYNPCKPINGTGAENRDTQTNRTLFYGTVNAPANTTDNGAKNLTLGGRLDVNSGIIGIGHRGTNGVDPNFSQNGEYKDTNGNLYRSSNSIRMGTGITLNEANNKEASIAIGVDTKSTGLRTVAIGWAAEATGNEDVAYGVRAKASGGQAVALGPSTQAIGAQSTAIGNNSISRGDSSVAIGGDDLNAVSKDAGGNFNQSDVAKKYKALTGDELVQNTAAPFIPTESGTAAVAVGVQAKASGSLSTAFGTRSAASGVASLALGVGSNASKENAVALGAGSTTAAAATSEKMATVGSITYGSAANPFAGSGSVTAGDQVSIGTAGFERQIKHVAPGAINAASTDAINGSQLFYVTQGLQNQIGAAKTHYYSVKGSGATDGNYNNDGATGTHALAAGVNASASAEHSVAVGSAAKAMDKGTVAFGNDAQATGRDALGIGTTTRANGMGATAIGNTAESTKHGVAIGNGAHAKATGGYSTAVGTGSKAMGDAAVALANDAKAGGRSSVAVGREANAGGDAAISIGESAAANAAQAIAMGREAKVTKNNNIAIGYKSSATGERTVVVGPNAIATADDATTIGSAATATKLRSSAFGSNAKADGIDSSALGQGAEAKADSATAIGSKAIASQGSSTSIGTEAKVAAASGVAIGAGAKVEGAGQYGTAIGSGASATHSKSVALGSSSTTENAVGTNTATVGNITYGGFAGTNPVATVSVGNGSEKRTITNVAAGRISATSTDAINGSQLYATQTVIGNVAGSMKNILGGNAAVGADGKLSMNNIGGTGKGNIHEAIQASRTTVSSNNGSLTVTKTTNGTTGADNYDLSVNAQGLAESAQLPVVYTKADGSKVYKHTDGKFYTQPNGAGTQVAAGDVIASMQNAAGSTTEPTTLANVKSNLADTTNAVNNPANNSRADFAGKGNNAATVNDVLNAGFTVQGNGVNKDFVTHGDTVNFANGQGTVAKVTSTNGVTTVKVDTPMTYADASGNPTNTPTNRVNLVGGTAGNPVTLGNVADGTVAAGSKEAVNGGQLYATNQNVAKGINFGGTTGSNNYKLGDTINVKGDSNITSTTIAGGTQLALNPNLNVTSVTTTDAAGNKTVTNGSGVTITPAAGGGNPVSLTTGGLNNGGNKITNVARGTDGTDAVNVNQLNAAKAAATSKIEAGNGISVSSTPNADGSTTYKVAADTTALNVGDGTGGNPAGKVIAPAPADANKLATAGDIAKAINNSGFNIDAGGNVAGNHSATLAKPGSTLTLKAGNGLTVKQEVDGNGNQSYTYALNAQSVVQSAQTPVAYTKADGSKVYKHTDGKFYTQPNGAGTQVAAGDVIASMQNAAGSTTEPTTLANVKSNLADTTNAVNNPANNSRADFAGKGNNAATVNDVLNAGFTVQGNGVNKDFVTHGDTVNFANGQGTVAKVTSTNGVTTVKVDTPMTYADASGNPTNTPTNRVNLVGGTAGNPVTLGNVADGTVAAGSKEAVNGGQLYATNQNVAKGINFGGTTGSNNYKLGDTINVKGDSNITSTTIAGGTQLALNPNLNVTSVTTTDAAGNKTVTNGSGVTITPAAGGGNPVSLTTGGLNNGGNKITNVARGTDGTDAVNVNQLNAALGALSGTNNANIIALDAKVNDVANTANAGVAQAIATAGLPQAYLPGKNMVAVGGGYYKGETGYAVGFSTISDSGNWIIKATGSGNSRGNFGASIGAGYQW
ncbi:MULTISPECIES: YadA-like family protein [Eikenella]|nr:MULTISPECIES: YadA-like family protein [Eikenella]